MSGQAWLFLLTVAAGFCLGLLYDGFRVLRVAVKHHNLVIQVEDVLFWASSSFGMFYFLMNVNGGEVRVFCVVGVAVGMTLYFCTLSFIIMKVSIAAVAFVKKVAAVMLAVILLPVRFALRVLSVPAAFLSARIKSAKKPVKKRLQNCARYVKMKKQAVVKGAGIIAKKV